MALLDLYIRIRTISKELFISESAFEKRFKKIVGTTPKKFVQIIRLRHVIDQMGSQTEFAEMLYYDQAHFIKEFKALTGLTPKAYQKQNNKEE